MKSLIAVFAVLLAGCGQSESQLPPAQIDYEGARGTRVGYDSDVSRNDPAQYEKEFISVEQCMFERGHIESTVPGPLVRVVSNEINGHAGWVDWETGQITITLLGSIRHEMVHYILWRTGFDNTRNAAHEHAAFNDCAPPKIQDAVIS